MVLILTHFDVVKPQWLIRCVDLSVNYEPSNKCIESILWPDIIFIIVIGSLKFVHSCRHLIFYKKAFYVLCVFSL